MFHYTAIFFACISLHLYKPHCGDNTKVKHPLHSHPSQAPSPTLEGGGEEVTNDRCTIAICIGTVTVTVGLRPSDVVYNLHACIHKSILNVSHSLSAKLVLTGKKMFYFTNHIFKHEIQCEKLKSAYPLFAY